MPDPIIDPAHPVVQQLEAKIEQGDAKQQVQLDSNTQKLGGWGMLTTPQGVTAIIAGVLSLIAAYKSVVNPTPSAPPPPPPLQVEVTFPKGLGLEPLAPPVKQEAK